MKEVPMSRLVSSTALALILIGGAGTVSAQQLVQCSIEQPSVPCVAPDGSTVENRRQFRRMLEAMGITEVRPILSQLGGAEEEGESDDPGQQQLTQEEIQRQLEEAAAEEAAQQAAQQAAEQAAAEQAAAQRAAERAAQRAAEQAAAEQAAAQAAAEAAAQQAAEREASDQAEIQAQIEADLAARRLQEAMAEGLMICDLSAPTLPCVTPNGDVLTEIRQLRDFLRASGVQDVGAILRPLRANQQGQDVQQSEALQEQGQGEVQTEQVQEGDVRGAGEEFETAVGQQQETREEDEGLSDFQRALLLGLGAVVVGSVLANGDEVVANTGDRVVVDDGAALRVLRDDDVLLRQPGAEVVTETFSDGSTRSVIKRVDGSQVVTIRTNTGTVLRRVVINPDGTEVILFDDTVGVRPVVVSELPPAAITPQVQASAADVAGLRRALEARLQGDAGRTFTLSQIREIKEVRALAPQVALDTVRFETGSAAIPPSQSSALVDLGLAISQIVAEDPDQVFLVEGHTDAVGSEAYNLALSDRRAETVALALTQYFGVPPENLVTQGYGESDLLIRTELDEPLNRRAAVRNISGLLR
jgi:outer membrane protein OmpA-like peptidoglycan-associated protein